MKQNLLLNKIIYSNSAVSLKKMSYRKSEIPCRYHRYCEFYDGHLGGLCKFNHSDMAEAWAEFMNEKYEKYGFDDRKLGDWTRGYKAALYIFKREYKTALDMRNAKVSPEIVDFYKYCQKTSCRLYRVGCGDKKCIFSHPPTSA